MTIEFNERRAAQALAWLLSRGGAMAGFRLLHLLYRAERLSLQRYGEPITGDLFVAGGLGPLHSKTIGILGQVTARAPGELTSWIRCTPDYWCDLAVPGMPADIRERLLALSDSDVECLDEVWATHGHLYTLELAQRLKAGELPEWNPALPSGTPIDHSAILRAGGWKPDAVAAMLRQQAEQAEISRTFAAP